MSALPIVESCEGCGLCCRTMGVPFHFGPSRPGVDPFWANVPTDLRADLQHFIDEGAAELGTPCYWYDAANKICRHHAYRPKICRDFELGSQRCINLRRDKGFEL